jgi:regulator of replication initiation timing
MFFGWNEVAAVYTFSQLLFYAGLFLAILSFLLFGISQIIRDNSRLREENEVLRKKIAKMAEEEFLRKKSVHL